MIHRMDHLDPQIKVSLLFGSRTWLDSSVSAEMKARRPDQFNIYSIKNAGHHVFADRPDEFNKVVKGICESEDNALS